MCVNNLYKLTNSNLEREAFKESFLGKALPQLEKLLWLIIGAGIVFISQLLK
jgi:transcriptional regulator of met regulon